MTDEFYSFFPRYDTVNARLAEMRKRFEFISVFTLGASVLSRKIQAVSLGNRKKAALYVGTVHGSEWITTLLLMRFLDEICENYSVYEKRLSRCGIIIVPMLNPDGAEIAMGGLETLPERYRALTCYSGVDLTKWQANAAGIDLNHNFDAGFAEVKRLEAEAGITAPGRSRFGGDRPESEPESAAITHFIRSFDITLLIAFHSQGSEIYYRYGINTPFKSKALAEIFSASSGYEICEPQGTASHGGLKDWFIEKFSRPGFTFEVGRGENPLLPDRLPQIWSELREAMLTGMLLG